MTPAPVESPMKKPIRELMIGPDGADGGECFLADKVADNDAVNGVVKLLEEISGHQRKREEKKLFPDRALGHIAGFALLYCFRHSSPLFYVDFTFFFIVAL